MKCAVYFLAAFVATATASTVPENPPGLFDRPATAEQLLKTTLAVPAAELSSATVLTGQFTQRRYLTGLPRPLVSTGEFMLARGKGILWRTSKPFPTEFVLTPSGMTLRDGTSETRVPGSEHPAVRVALEVFFAMFALDVARLSDRFELYGQAAGDGWQIGLRPRDAGLAQVFSEAVITGRRTVERVDLIASGGDRTEIELSGVELRTTPLDPSEAARFQ